MTIPALFETMAVDPVSGVARLDRHLARLSRSAALLGHRYDEDAVRCRLKEAVAGIATGRRLRLTLSPDGEMHIELSPLPAPIHRAVVTLVPLPVASDDYRLRHKTTDRRFYDTTRDAAGTFEVVFVDQDGAMTEGSFTNLFVRRGDRLITPPAHRGLLPGVLRAELLDTGKAIEGDVYPRDLGNACYIGNALRGLIPAMLRT